ncbi:MAG: Yip1 family protein [Betaproteobacteria bacterium]
MALVDRVKNILLTPKTEWPVIAGEEATPQSIYVGYVLILAAIGPIAMAVRGGMFGITAGIFGYAVSLVVTFALAWIVDALAPTFGGEKNFVQSLKLVAYSYTAAWIAAVFNILGAIGGVIGLLGAIYAFYTFYLGVPVMKKCPAEKAIAYTIVVVICGIVLGVVLGGFLMTAILGGGMMGGTGLMR